MQGSSTFGNVYKWGQYFFVDFKCSSSSSFYSPGVFFATYFSATSRLGKKESHWLILQKGSSGRFSSPQSLQKFKSLFTSSSLNSSMSYGPFSFSWSILIYSQAYCKYSSWFLSMHFEPTIILNLSYVCTIYNPHESMLFDCFSMKKCSIISFATSLIGSSFSWEQTMKTQGEIGIAS